MDRFDTRQNLIDIRQNHIDTGQTLTNSVQVYKKNIYIVKTYTIYIFLSYTYLLYIYCCWYESTLCVLSGGYCLRGCMLYIHNIYSHASSIYTANVHTNMSDCQARLKTIWALEQNIKYIKILIKYFVSKIFFFGFKFRLALYVYVTSCQPVYRLYMLSFCLWGCLCDGNTLAVVQTDRNMYHIYTFAQYQKLSRVHVANAT